MVLFGMPRNDCLFNWFSLRLNESCTVHSKMNGDSYPAQPEDDHEEEEDFLDPNSAFVSVAVSKNKRGYGTAALSHMDRSQRTSNTKRSTVRVSLSSLQF